MKPFSIIFSAAVCVSKTSAQGRFLSSLSTVWI